MNTSGRFTVVSLAAGVMLASVAAGTATASCGPLPCSQVLVGTPLALDFDKPHGGVVDGRGIGTGFTYVDGAARGGYVPERIATGDGVLELRTDHGINYANANSLENGLAVGVAKRTEQFTVETILDAPPRGSGRWEQAGLWVGTGDDDYVKFVVASAPGGPRIQLLGEKARKPPAEGGIRFASSYVPAPAAGSIRLLLEVDVVTRTISGHYGIAGGATKRLATISVPRNLVSRPAGEEAELDGSRFAGVFASHRRATTPVAYRFDMFALCLDGRCSPSDGGSGGGPKPDIKKPSAPPNRKLVRKTAGTLTASIRHPRRIRMSRLLSRGVRLRLRCSEACGVRTRLLGPRRLVAAPAASPKRPRIHVGAGRARLRSAGGITTRVHVRPRVKSKLRDLSRVRLTIKAAVTGDDGRRVVLRSTVLARR
jgi:hypothetical protein